MPCILLIAGSPTRPSRSTFVLEQLQAAWKRRGFTAELLSVRDLPAEPLLHGEASHPAIAEAIAQVAGAQAVIVGTPIYKAAYAGSLKVFLDLLPSDAFADKVAVPIATGGSVAHLLALDYSIKPLLTALGARHILAGAVIPDAHLPKNERGGYELLPESEDRLRHVTASLEQVLLPPLAHRSNPGGTDVTLASESRVLARSAA